MLAQQSPDNIRPFQIFALMNRGLLSALTRPLTAVPDRHRCEDQLSGCIVEVNLKAGTLTEHLTYLHREKADYNWKYQDGVVIFYGRSGAPAIANLYIRHFEAHDVTRSQMYSALDDLPEIETWLAVNDCQRRELFKIRASSAG